MKDLKLICTGCSKTFNINQTVFRCDECNEPLEVELIRQGKINESQFIFDRYREFLPFEQVDDFQSLGEGLTPLVKIAKFSQMLGIQNLYIKNESHNPTWSFKDRGTASGIIYAKKLGYKKVGTVSTGNMAPSVAAYSASNGLDAYILVKGEMSDEKIAPIAIYKPKLIRVHGDYGELYYKSLDIGKANQICFINSDAPMRIEGSKTIAFEICEQVNFKIPDYVIVPTSAGGNVRGIEKGFREFKAAGLIDRVPKIIVAQAAGCAPIAEAFEKNKMIIEKLEQFGTIAHAIENHNPPSGNQVLRMVKNNGGLVETVSEEQIIEAQEMMARAGLFGQPASAVPLAAAIKLSKKDFFTENQSVVLILTGSGLKFTEAFKHHKIESEQCSLNELGEFVENLMEE